MVEGEDWAFGHGHVEFAMPLRQHVQISVEQRGKGVPSLGGRCVSHQRSAGRGNLLCAEIFQDKRVKSVRKKWGLWLTLKGQPALNG